MHPGTVRALDLRTPRFHGPLFDEAELEHRLLILTDVIEALDVVLVIMHSSFDPHAPLGLGPLAKFAADEPAIS